MRQETGALGKALAHVPPASNPTTLAAAKACLGHTEGTAGLSGLLVAMTHLLDAATPPLPLRALNAYVAAGLEDWPSRAR